VARHFVRTPGTVQELTLRLDESGRPFAAGGADVAFLYAELRDGDERTVPDAWENVSFGSTGDLQLVGENPFSSDAGIASILVRADSARPNGLVCALAMAREGDRTHVMRDVLAFGEASADYEVRVTTDGSDPAGGAIHRGVPVFGAGPVRAALLAGGRVIVEARSDSRKFRIPGSTAPEQEA